MPINREAWAGAGERGHGDREMETQVVIRRVETGTQHRARAGRGRGPCGLGYEGYEVWEAGQLGGS